MHSETTDFHVFTYEPRLATLDGARVRSLDDIGSLTPGKHIAILGRGRIGRRRAALLPRNGHEVMLEPIGRLIRVLVVHGDRLARAGLAALLEPQPDVAVVGLAADGMEAVALAEELRPDVLVVDMAVPGMDAFDVTRRIVAGADSSSIRVLILGDSDQDEEIFSFLRAGASGFLVRDAEPSDLTQGIRRVAAGEAALSPSSVRRVIDELAGQPNPGVSPEILEELTTRELEVMGLVAVGLNNDEIAEHLVVTQATAKTHVNRVMNKLGAHHRAQLVTLAYETGLVHPRHPTGTTSGRATRPRPQPACGRADKVEGRKGGIVQGPGGGSALGAAGPGWRDEDRHENRKPPAAAGSRRREQSDCSGVDESGGVQAVLRSRHAGHDGGKSRSVSRP